MTTTSKRPVRVPTNEQKSTMLRGVQATDLKTSISNTSKYLLPYSLVLALLWLSSFALMAASPPSRPVDQGLETYQDLMRKGSDDPHQAQLKALKCIQEPHKDDRSLWLQCFLYLADQAPEALTAEQKSADFIKNTAEEATRLDLKILALRLRYRLDFLSQADPLPLQQNYKDQALEIDDPRFAVYLLSEAAFDAYRQGDMKQSLLLSQEAFKCIEGRVSPQDVQILELKSLVAIFMEYAGEREKSAELFREAISAFEIQDLRATLAITLGNYARLLIRDQNYAEAARLYQRMREIGESLHSDATRGQSLKGLGYVQSQQGQMAAAVESFRLAISLLSRSQEDPGAIADTYKLLGAAYNKQKEWDKALESFAMAAEEKVSMQDKSWAQSLQKGRVEAYVALGKTDEALRLALLVNEQLSEIMEEDKKSEMSKLKVSMGLQLEEQKNSMLTAQNLLQRRFLIGIMSLAGLVIFLLALVLHQTQKVKQNREKMQNILDSIEEGILTIGPGMKVEASLSPYLHHLLKLDQNAVDVFEQFVAAIDLDAHEKSMLQAVLSTCLGEDGATWDFNCGQLPAELSLAGGGQWLALHWQPLFNEQRVVQNILIVVRDVTETRRLRRERDHAEQGRRDTESHLLQLLAIDPREGRSFVKEFSETLALLDRHLLNSENITACSHALHSCKGLARSLGLRELSLIVHELEDQIDVKAGLLRNVSAADVLLQRFRLSFADYATWVHRLFPEGHASRRTPGNLYDQVSRCLPALQEQLQTAGLELETLVIDDGVLHWDAELLEKIGMILRLGLTNSVDHGFVLPLQRGENLSDRPRFVVEARRVPGSYQLRLRDNGAGLDREKLKSMARERGFEPGPDQSWSDVLFLDGISTAETVTQTSGRGVGLAAIRQLCQDLKGTSRIYPNEETQGTCLDICFPQEAREAVA